MHDPISATKTASGRHRTALKQLSSNLWYLVQFFALAAIVMSSFWGDGRHVDEGALREGFMQRGSFANSVRVDRPSSITSRVVSLPAPSALGTALKLEVETRQMRFERGWATTVGLEVNAGRAPASTKEWMLDGIERRVGKTWEKVPLVRNEDHEIVGSSFVELENGTNEFRVTYRDSRGHTTVHPVRIKHVKTSKS